MDSLKSFTKEDTLMNIVTLIDTFVSTLLQAEQGFIEHPDHAGRFEEAQETVLAG